MQFVNDDMDDELYRRAAEEYPLKTDGADWNKLREKLAVGDGNKFHKKRIRRGFVLLALIPLVLICTTYITADRSLTGLERLNQNEINPDLTTKSNATESAKQGDINATGLVEKSELNEHSNKEKNIAASEQSIADKNFELLKRNQNRFPPTSLGITIFESKGNNRMRSETPDNNSVSGEKINTLDQQQPVEKRSDEPAEPNVLANNGGSSQNPITDSTIRNKKLVQEDSVKLPPLQSSAKERLGQKRQYKFYLGVLAGPDFSMVKSTNTGKTGYNVGLIAGYNLNKKFAIETGLLWDQKKYTSEGQYFNTEKLNWPHVTILDLSGYCNMFEVPVMVRYNVINNSKTTWFANAGISSYLMKNENYDYRYQRYGVYGYGNKEYKNTTNNWFSVAHLSVGIQKKIGTIADLRIEPYVKLPLNGVGIGSMPLRSAGIYLGITRPIR